MRDPETAYNHALDYLYSYVDYSLKHSSEFAKAEFNLERMRALMGKLGNPQDRYPILHVAGTKGKGSVCAMAASGLHAAGYSVGLYTSPHLLDYCERIQVNGQPVSHDGLVNLVDRVRDAVADVPKLTTFEITTALALQHFVDAGVDVGVIEVGLGGRLDATNVVSPSVCVITSLSYDHMAVLGDTLTKIATEKAGIIKRGVPVISAPQEQEALKVLVDTALEKDSAFTLVGRDVNFKPLSHSLDNQSLCITRPQDELRVQIPLLGSHQIQNAAIAATALRELNERGLQVPDLAIQKGFAAVNWPARFQIARREPPIILDSAHNQDSFARLHQTLQDYFPGRRAYLVFGASEDKNLPGMLQEIKDDVIRVIITKAEHPRALSPEDIVPHVRKAGIEHEVVVPVRAAFERALELSQKDGSIVLSAGSMFVTAEALAAWHTGGMTLSGLE